MKKLRQSFDRRFFVFITLIFLVSSLAGLIWFWSESQAQVERGSFKDLVAEKFRGEDQKAIEDKDEASKLDQKENASDIFSSPAVLGEATETVTKETTTQTRASLNMDSVNLTSLANEALLALKDCLLKNDAYGLYSMAGEDLRTTFDKEGFAEALTKGEKVTEVNIISGPKILGEWAEATLEIIYSDNATKRYGVVFHLEQGEWKLFGTEEAG